jgi:TrmH family RNA methyltransferase
MINSNKNQQIKDIMGLLNKGKDRERQGLYIVEGTKMVNEIPKEDLVKFYYSETFFNQLFPKELKMYNTDYEVVKDSVFEYISDTKTPQGILAVVRQKQYDIKELLTKEKPVLIILEDLQDPGNIGTIFRSAEGAGIDGIVLSKNCVDVYNPKVVRSTMGSVFRMPFYRVDNLESVLLDIKEQGIKLFAAHLKGKAYYDQENYCNTGVAFMIGNESKGLKEETAELANVYIKIPLVGKVESLNASVAASLLMYEVNRQRRI